MTRILVRPYPVYHIIIDNLFEEDSMLRELLSSAPFPFYKFANVNTCDTQVSRYGNDNQFYVWHQDRFDSDARLITMIYYLHNTPKKFQGGELCITNDLLYDGKIYGESDVVEIEPKNDRLVIFNSRAVHCVKPVTSPENFEDGRFSVNIWAGIV